MERAVVGLILGTSGVAGQDLGRQDESAVPDRPGRRLTGADSLIIGGYLVAALGVAGHLLTNTRSRVLAGAPSDQLQFEYWLAHAARVITHGDNPFFAPQLNVPDGVNMMANTSTLGLTIPLTPVTLFAGPAVAFLVMVVFSMAATATTWYLLFSRRVVRRRGAAAIGAAVCGFGPAIISQANGHPNVAAQFLVPLAIWQLDRLREPGRVLRGGILLGLVLAYQFFINEEILLITALGIGLFVAVWALTHWSAARACAGRFLAGLGVAALLSLAIVGYPLWFQVFGPQHYQSLPEVGNWGADLSSFTLFPSRSLGGHLQPPTPGVAQDVSEENTFFGWPLVVIGLGLAVLMWRDRLVRSAVATGLVMLVASIGTQVRWHGLFTTRRGPWALISRAPLFDSVVTTRLALFALPVFGLIIALAVDRYVLRPGARRWLRPIIAVAAVLALLPLVPTPFPVHARPVTPTFISSGQWRAYVPAGRTVVTVPLPSWINAMSGMVWAAGSQLAFDLPRGYFLGPNPAHPGHGMFGAPPRPTSDLLDRVAMSGAPVPVTAMNQQDAVADLTYWRAAIVVLPPSQPHGSALLRTTSDLLGFAPTEVGGMWIWDVRSMSG